MKIDTRFRRYDLKTSSSHRVIENSHGAEGKSDWEVDALVGEGGDEGCGRTRL